MGYNIDDTVCLGKRNINRNGLMETPGPSHKHVPHTRMLSTHMRQLNLLVSRISCAPSGGGAFKRLRCAVQEGVAAAEHVEGLEALKDHGEGADAEAVLELELVALELEEPR